jgi:hypothetical protein
MKSGCYTLGRLVVPGRTVEGFAPKDRTVTAQPATTRAAWPRRRVSGECFHSGAVNRIRDADLAQIETARLPSTTARNGCLKWISGSQSSKPSRRRWPFVSLIDTVRTSAAMSSGNVKNDLPRLEPRGHERRVVQDTCSGAGLPCRVPMDSCARNSSRRTTWSLAKSVRYCPKLFPAVLMKWKRGAALPFHSPPCRHLDLDQLAGR